MAVARLRLFLKAYWSSSSDAENTGKAALVRVFSLDSHDSRKVSTSFDWADVGMICCLFTVLTRHLMASDQLVSSVCRNSSTGFCCYLIRREASNLWTVTRSLLLMTLLLDFLEISAPG